MEHLLKISEFSYISGIKRKNLIYYDEIGLLSPERVLENGYRLYARRQLETVSVIEALREVGMPLCDIRSHLDERTPASLIELFTAQRKHMEEKIQRLERIEAMIDTRLGITRRGLEVDLSEFELKFCEEELLFASEEVACPGTEEGIQRAVEEFYIICDKEKIIYGYPFGTMVSKQNLLQGNSQHPSRFFFKMPTVESSRPRLCKPAGLYLKGFDKTSSYGSPRLYSRLFDHMKASGLVVAGNSYEEFLLDEIATKDPNGRILQISVEVGKG